MLLTYLRLGFQACELREKVILWIYYDISIRIKDYGL